MKKLLFALLLTAMASAPALAQDKKKTSAEWDNKVKTELRLTEDQVAKYDALSAEFEQKYNALEQDANLTKEAQKERKMQMKAEKESKMAEFLTPEQLTKYRDMTEEKKKKMKEKKS